MTAKTSFQGSFTALVTPFKNGALDKKAFRELVDWQLAEGTNGLVPVGTTGESPTLSHDEHKQVVEWCVGQANGRVPMRCSSLRPITTSQLRKASTSTSRRSMTRSGFRSSSTTSRPAQ